MEKQIRVTYSEFVSVALVIQHAKCMRRIVLSSMTSIALPYFFPHFLIKAPFSENVIVLEMCLDFLYNFVSKMSHSKKKLERDMTKNVLWSFM